MDTQHGPDQHDQHGPGGEGREFFTLLATQWDVTAALDLLADHGPGRVVDALVIELAPVLGFIGIDPDAALAMPETVLDKPLIAVPGDQPGRWRLIDGHHRIHKALSVGRERLTVHVLRAEDADVIRRDTL